MQKYNINFDLNKLLRSVKLKKQYIEKLKNKISFLNSIKAKNFRNLNSSLFSKNKTVLKSDPLIMYIMDITFSRSNTLVHLMDCSGKLKFFWSAGLVKSTGKGKRARFTVFRELYKVLLSKLKFIRYKPIALHLKNVGSNKFWIIKKLKKKFFIKIVKSFNLYPYNGCRKRKMRRKKFKKRRNG